MHDLEVRAAANSLLPSLVNAANRGEDTKNARDPAANKATIELVTALYFARRLSFQEYTFFVSVLVEGVHDGRTMGRSYPELVRLSADMETVRTAHGLKPSEYWARGDEPAEYRALNAKWDSAERARFGETLHEMENGPVSSLYARNRVEFDRLRERGRRAFVHTDEPIPVIADTIVRYEREAKAAASASAFTAAVILLGAAVEGLLLLRCLRSRTKSGRVATKLPKGKRPKDSASPSKWTFDTLILVCLEAGWLPEIDTPSMRIRPDGLAHLLRQMRNFVHPGRVATSSPWIEIDQRDFADAEIVYTTLFATMYKGAALKKLGEARPPH